MSAAKISNPILPGFNPDPSVVRVGDNYYIATSTFEWYPGVQIHHSRDLKHWRLISRPLNRPALLNMIGEPDSCGVWAPCLTHADGLFWLIYTDVKRFDGNFKDTHNYLTTCDTIDGQWSDPVYLNSSGFDPSLFHDEDGRKWLVNMIWDHRPDRSFFGGIALQQYDPKEQSLLGEPEIIFRGSELGLTEGPHLYKRGGFYYLLTAEGGTGYDHAMTMARSENLLGPYEVDPIGHFITARDNPELTLQRCGHGDWVETTNGEHYAVHLCSRPLSAEQRFSPMGRETALQKVFWNTDGWLRLEHSPALPGSAVTAADLPEHPWPPQSTHFDFSGPDLPERFQWLRTPYPEQLFSLTERPGFLRLYGRESLGSHNLSSLVATRQTAFDYRAETCVSFEPISFQQMAGLVCYYNSQKFHYLYISCDDEGHRQINIMSCLAEINLQADFPIEPVSIASNTDVTLRAEVKGASLKFSYRESGHDWHTLPVELDYSLLSCEAGKGEGASFTGAFVGMACQDISGRRRCADFSYFNYEE